MGIESIGGFVSDPQRFETTRWTVVLATRSTDVRQSRRALAELCETYWHPLYVFVRRQGYGPDAARDLTQSFFVELLEKDFLRKADPERGRFRSFLLAALKYQLAQARRHDRAVKRGGEHRIVDWIENDAEALYARDAALEDSPERAFERRWALTIIERARERLADEMSEDGRRDQFERLAPMLGGGGEGKSYRELAGELDTSEAAVKMAVMRLRRRFGRYLRDEIAHTVLDPSEVDDELRYLLRAVRDG
jgi:RNA polymerase sigma-70 factor (ECF subfamily)